MMLAERASAIAGSAAPFFGGNPRRTGGCAPCPTRRSLLLHDHETVGARERLGARAVVVAEPEIERPLVLLRPQRDPLLADGAIAFDVATGKLAVGLVLEARRRAPLRRDAGCIGHHPLRVAGDEVADGRERVVREQI